MADKGLDFKTETVSLGSLTPHPRNYRDHPETQLVHIEQSIRDHGFYRNIVVSSDNFILAGHGVAVAAGRMGFKEVPIRRLNVKHDDPLALKVIAGDNEMGNLAIVNDRVLTEMLKDISESADNIEGLLGTGFDEAMLASLLYTTRSADEIATLDQATEWVGMPEFVTESETVLTIRFANEEDRDRLVEKLDIGDGVITRGKRIWSTWWPARERDYVQNLKFTTEPEAEETEAASESA